jgi:hypothetical protein
MDIKQELSDAKAALSNWISDADEAKQCYLDALIETKGFNIYPTYIEFLTSYFLRDFPKINIKQRYDDALISDPKINELAKITEKILSRTLNYFISDVFSFSEIVNFKNNFFVSGSGVLWIETDISDDKQNVNILSLGCDEYLQSCAARQSDVWWVARKHKLTSEEKFKNFGVQDGYVPTSAGVEKKAKSPIWEIWDKSNREILFYDESADKVLKKVKSKTESKYFLPTTGRLNAVYNFKDLTPTAEFKKYERMIKQISSLYKKIQEITEKIKLVTFFPSSMKDIARELTNAKTNEYIPLDFAVNLNGNLNELFVKENSQERQEVAIKLNEYLQTLIQQFYELAGVSEILRGEDSAKDLTATEIKLKDRYGNFRIQQKQNNLQNYLLETYKISINFIINNFSPAKIQEIASIDLTPIRDFFEDTPDEVILGTILETLKQNLAFSHIFTISEDGNENKKETQEYRLKLLETFFAIIKETQEALMASPESFDIIKPIVTFALDSFDFPISEMLKIDSVFDNLKTQIEQRMSSQEPEDETPEMMAARAELQKSEADLISAKARELEAKTKSIKTANDITNADREFALKEGQEQNLTPGA